MKASTAARRVRKKRLETWVWVVFVLGAAIVAALAALLWCPIFSKPPAPQKNGTVAQIPRPTSLPPPVVTPIDTPKVAHVDHSSAPHLSRDRISSFPPQARRTAPEARKTRGPSSSLVTNITIVTNKESPPRTERKVLEPSPTGTAPDTTASSPTHRAAKKPWRPWDN